MMPADKRCRFQCPKLSILCQHNEILLSLCTILTMIADDYMHAFTPCCIIVYREFQFHGLQTFLQKYKIIMKYALFIMHYFVPLQRKNTKKDEKV
jgi:hypothetical protein